MKDLFGNEVPDPPFINERKQSTKPLTKDNTRRLIPEMVYRPYTTIRDKDGSTWVMNAPVRSSS